MDQQNSTLAPKFGSQAVRGAARGLASAYRSVGVLGGPGAALLRCGPAYRTTRRYCGQTEAGRAGSKRSRAAEGPCLSSGAFVCTHVEEVVAGHAGLTGDTGGDNDNVGVLERLSEATVGGEVAGDHRGGVDVRQVGGDTGGVDAVRRRQESASDASRPIRIRRAWFCVEGTYTS